MNPLKSRMRDGTPTRGVWLEAGSPVMAEACCLGGCKFLMIDNEHGPASTETTAHMIRAIEAAGGHPMVRVAANDPVLLKRVLEIGLRSIMIPLINTVAEAEAAVAACLYPPQGTRGFAGDIRASGYGSDAGYAKRANDDMFLMLQIESPQGVQNADEIAAVPGVDMLFIGPYDMSGGFGKLGQTDCPEVEEAIAGIEKMATARAMPLGTVPRAGKSAKALLEGGYGLVIAESEISMAMASLSQSLAEDGTA